MEIKVIISYIMTRKFTKKIYVSFLKNSMESLQVIRRFKDYQINSGVKNELKRVIR